MTIVLAKGRYRARQSRLAKDIEAAQSLRARAFGCDDRDALDALSMHILVEDVETGDVRCCFRMLLLPAAEVEQSYSAQFYDLSALQAYEGLLVEMGRFCIDPEVKIDPDVVRIAWGAMTAFVDKHDVKLMFGCSSFVGTDPTPYLNSFAVLAKKHLGPDHLRPKKKSNDVFCFDTILTTVHGPVRAMPSLLRTYLMMGGWVSDHAVIDPQMNTMHVFTGVEVSRIPDVRKRLLRAVVG
ncbi:GNAT family N-acetyltransferase [Planktotalea sp.]|uniref:GNAT family N-acetyltransferase n=1 Tax=Planktotalea sp. TaxID=2029877 RepID=UPI0035C8576B